MLCVLSLSHSACLSICLAWSSCLVWLCVFCLSVNLGLSLTLCLSFCLRLTVCLSGDQVVRPYGQCVVIHPSACMPVLFWVWNKPICLFNYLQMQMYVYHQRHLLQRILPSEIPQLPTPPIPLLQAERSVHPTETWCCWYCEHQADISVIQIGEGSAIPLADPSKMIWSKLAGMDNAEIFNCVNNDNYYQYTHIN